MRRARTALIMSVLLMGATGLRAQPAHSVACHESGCRPGIRCQSCSVGGGMTTFTATVNQALLGILPSTIGCDARHKIYKAALRRSTFDKKIVPFIPYYGHAFPCYDGNRQCCGPLVPAAECPTGESYEMDGDVIEMQDIPLDGQMPTPAIKRPAEHEPSQMVPSKEARQRFSKGRKVSQAARKPRSGAVAERKTHQKSISRKPSAAVAVQALNKFISWEEDAE